MNIFKYMCHQIPERSFFLKGHQFPVCARCTGGYISIFLMTLAYYFFPISKNPKMFLFGIILIIPAFIDGITQLFKLRESNNTLRFITGFLLGIGLIVFIKTFKYFILYTLEV